MNSPYLFSSALRGGLTYSGACNSWSPFFLNPFQLPKHLLYFIASGEGWGLH